MATALQFARKTERKLVAIRRRGFRNRVRVRVIPFPRWFRSVFSEYLENLPAEHHGEMFHELRKFHRRRGRKKVRLAPRGFAKTVVMQAYACYCAGYGLESFIIWLSNMREQSIDALTTIRGVIEYNDAFKRYCPEAAGKGPTWRKDRLVLRNGVRIDAFGALQNIRGRRWGAKRPTLIIGDDLQKTEQMESGAMRRRTNAWWDRDVSYLGGPKTNLYVTDTAIHPEAVSYRLATKTPGWDSKIYRAMIEWPEAMHLWRKWKDIFLDYSHGEQSRSNEARKFYQERREQMDAGARVLWPDRFPLYYLMQKWAETGEAAFNSEFQNNPTDPTRVLWSADCFDWESPSGETIYFDDWPENLAIKTVGVDASLGKRDYFASVFLGVSATSPVVTIPGQPAGKPNVILWVDAILDTRDPETMVDLTVDYANWWKPHGFMIEDLVFQSLLRPVFKAAMRRRAMDVRIYPDEDMSPKNARIMRLGKYVSPRRVRIKRRSAGAALLLEQLRFFPTSEFDDGPDAMEKAERCALAVLDGR